MAELVYRPEFVAALTVLGRVCRAAVRMSGGATWPVLVGGAVVEFNTGSQFVSGDFDLVPTSDDAFTSALRQEGFT